MRRSVTQLADAHGTYIRIYVRTRTRAYACMQPATSARAYSMGEGLEKCKRQQHLKVYDPEVGVLYATMEAISSENTAVVVLECHLHSRSEGTTEVRHLSLSALPHTVLELKEVVQSEFSVPACAQTVAYQTEVLTDDVVLTTRRLRSGDTIDVMFLCRGDCHSLEEVNAWMRHLIQTFDRIQLQPEVGDYEVEVVVYDGMQSGLDAALGYDLFEWLIPRTMVNKAYFESTGGLHILLELYQRIFSRTWSSLRVYQKYLESICTQAFANFGETCELRRKLVKLGLLELCFKALLRVPITLNQSVTDPSSKASDQEMNDSLLKGELDNALHLLCWCVYLFVETPTFKIITVLSLSHQFPSISSPQFLRAARVSVTHRQPIRRGQSDGVHGLESILPVSHQGPGVGGVPLSGTHTIHSPVPGHGLRYLGDVESSSRGTHQSRHHLEWGDWPEVCLNKCPHPICVLWER